MQDEAFRKELAARKAEADRGDAAAAVEKLLSEIPKDLSQSVVDSSREIAEIDELLGLDPDPDPESPPDPPSNNGSH